MADEEVSDEVQAQRDAKLASLASTSTTTVEDHVQVDYFGAAEEHTVVLPDGVSTITHKTFMEGDKRKYMNAVNRDLVINQQTRDARLRMAPGDDRYNLLKQAIVGWTLTKNGAPFPFTARNVDEVLNNFPPAVLDVVEADIRKQNPWLLSEVTIEDIDKEIANLQELRDRKIKEAEGKGDSSS